MLFKPEQGFRDYIEIGQANLAAMMSEPCPLLSGVERYCAFLQKDLLTGRAGSHADRRITLHERLHALPEQYRDGFDRPRRSDLPAAAHRVGNRHVMVTSCEPIQPSNACG